MIKILAFVRAWSIFWEEHLFLSFIVGIVVLTVGSWIAGHLHTLFCKKVHHG